MFKYILFNLLFLLYSVHSFAQNVQQFEGEVNIGLTTPLSNYHNGQKMMGPEFGLELRYNIPQTFWDCGLLLNVSTSVYRYEDSPKSDWYWEQSNRSINIAAVGDYNFKQGSKINPYIGVGIGLSLYDAIDEVVYESSGATFVFRPRVGIEVFRHLRIGLFATINKPGYHNIGVSIGGVIGGRSKKQ